MTRVTLSRRQILAGTAGIAGAVALPGGRASAQRGPVAQHKVGAATITVVSDGTMAVTTDRIVGDAPAVAGKAMVDRLNIANGASFAINVCVVDIGGKRVLIDAGAGGNWVPTGGKLADNLVAAGIAPESIDLVVLTHAHADHMWGVIDDLDDSLRFPKAQYALSEVEFDFWSGTKASSTQGVNEGMAAGSRRVLKSIEPKLTRFKPDTDLLPGLTMIEAGGHTPGQCAALIKSGGQAWLTAADTLFHQIVSVEHPEWQPAQDMDGARAVATRRRLLDLALSEKAVISAYHIEAGPGRVEKAGATFRWVAA